MAKALIIISLDSFDIPPERRMLLISPLSDKTSTAYLNSFELSSIHKPNAPSILFPLL